MTEQDIIPVPHSIVPSDRRKIEHKTVQLMATCLCDTFYDDVAQATVQVLEHLECTVTFPRDQTCCGQPAFNTGDWEVARNIVRNMMMAFDGKSLIVVPSGSCTAMILHGLPMAFADQPDHDKALSLTRQTWELADFIVNGLNVDHWPGRFEGRLALHRSCHCRGTASADAAHRLLSSIEGVEVLELGEPEQCCGFGGVFSIGFPVVSREIGQVKLDHITAIEADYLVSPDMGCLLHLGGLLDRTPTSPKRKHVAQVLRDALGLSGADGVVQ